MHNVDLGNFVGLSYSAQAIQDFIRSLDPVERDAEIAAPDMVYYIARAAGISLAVDVKTNRIVAIFIFAEGDRPGYRGIPPAGLRLSMTRQQVRAHMRPADRSRDVPVMSDTWEEGDYKIVVEYNRNESIKKISLTAK